MADNVPVTPGVGKDVTTDEVSDGSHAQVMKLAISTDGSRTLIPADATYGLAVDVKRVSGNVPVIGPTAHDAAASTAPVVTAGVASAAAPSDVSADGDVVQDWNLRNGAKAVAVTAAGALIPGDATNGLDVDVTRVPTDPFGANADAASASGSISAKLRQIATNGIPVTDSEKLADNAGFTDGTTKLMPVGFILDEVAGTSLTENDIAAPRIDAKRAQVMVFEDKTTRGQRATVTSNSSLQVDPQGNVAHDAADSGNPVKIGARAQAAAASVTAVAVADRSDLVCDLDGALIARPCRLADLISDVKTNTDGSSTAFTGSFAAAANLYNYVTSVTICNTSASAVTVDLRDGTGGSVIWTGIAPAGGGITHAFATPLRQPTVNTALALDGSAAASTITVSVVGFKSKA